MASSASSLVVFPVICFTFLNAFRDHRTKRRWFSQSLTFEPIRRQRGIAHRFDTRRLHSACKIRRPGSQRAGPDFEHSQGLAHHQHLPSAAFKHPRLKPGKLCCAAAVPCPSISPTRRITAPRCYSPPDRKRTWKCSWHLPGNAA